MKVFTSQVLLSFFVGIVSLNSYSASPPSGANPPSGGPNPPAAAPVCRYEGFPNCVLPDINDPKYGLITACLTKITPADSPLNCENGKRGSVDYPLQVSDLTGHKIYAAGCYDDRFTNRKDPLPDGACPENFPFRLTLPFATYCKTGKATCKSGGFIVVQPKVEAVEKVDLPRLQIFQPIVVTSDSDTLQTMMDICASQDGRVWVPTQNACVKTNAFKKSVCEGISQTWIQDTADSGHCTTQCPSCSDTASRCAGYEYIPSGTACLCKGTSTAKDVFGMSCKANPITLSQFQMGLSHACYIQNKKVYCFGDNGDEQISNNLGQGGNATAVFPGVVEVKGLSNAIALSIPSHSQFTCAVTSTGKVVLWGQPGWGSQMGNADYTEEGSLGKLRTQTSITTAVSCASTRSSTYAVLADRTVRAWGYGGSGLLGVDSKDIPKKTHDQGTPKEFKHMESSDPLTVLDSATDAPLTDVIQVTGTVSAACALKQNGNVYCWGDNSSSDLADRCAKDPSDCFLANVGVTDGSGNSVDAIIWKATKLNFVSNIKELRASYGEFCGLTNDGKTYCWGKKPTLISDIPTGKTVSPYESPSRVLPYFGSRCVLKNDKMMCATNPDMKDPHKMNGYVYHAGPPYEAEFVPVPNEDKAADVPTVNEAMVGHIWACTVHAGDCKIRCWGGAWNHREGTAIANIGPAPMVIDGADVCK